MINNNNTGNITIMHECKYHKNLIAKQMNNFLGHSHLPVLDGHHSTTLAMTETLNDSNNQLLIDPLLQYPTPHRHVSTKRLRSLKVAIATFFSSSNCARTSAKDCCLETAICFLIQVWPLIRHVLQLHFFANQRSTLVSYKRVKTSKFQHAYSAEGNVNL